MVRILRALDPFTYKTLQRGNPVRGTGQKVSGDKDVEGIATLARVRTAAKSAYGSAPWNKSRVPRT
jgi:hypothetical protein